jgi:nucleotide-binding universal stress UspA family protein
MLAIRNVLVATDFSECSSAALTYARALSRRFEARLHVVHVIEAVGAADVAGIGVYASTAPDLYIQMEASARDQLNRLISPADRELLHARMSTVTADTPARAIVEYARAEDIDLIVVGTHGRRGLSHLLLGSVAEKVVRAAPCPVLTVRHPEREFVFPDRTDSNATTSP